MASPVEQFACRSIKLEYLYGWFFARQYYMNAAESFSSHSAETVGSLTWAFCFYGAMIYLIF